MITLLLACAKHPPSQGLGPLVDEALPAVVLIVRDTDEGIGFGSGLRLEGTRVLTNEHVVGASEQVAVLLHRPDRPSYIDVDGGLDRFLFENQAELLPATVVAMDAELDLAVLDVPDAPPLDRALVWTDEVTLGESVVAVGHPKGTPWSFTAGVVSAQHAGMIQHDAAINRGNSGGPLLNRRGEVVGINTRKPMEASDGIGFARPVALARRLLDEEPAPEAVELADLSAGDALLTCVRSAEHLGTLPASCLDMDGLALAAQVAVVEVMSSGALNPMELAAVEKKAESVLRREHGLLETAVLDNLRRQDANAASPFALAGALFVTYEPEIVEARWGWPPDALHGAVRVGGHAGMLEDRVWVLLESPDDEGGVWSWPQLMVRTERGWALSVTATDDDLSELPEAWPPPVTTAAMVTDALARQAVVEVR